MDDIDDNIKPFEYTQIQKFTRADDDDVNCDTFTLLSVDHRKIIFQILDSIQPIVSNI